MLRILRVQLSPIGVQSSLLNRKITLLVRDLSIGARTTPSQKFCPPSFQAALLSLNVWFSLRKGGNVADRGKQYLNIIKGVLLCKGSRGLRKDGCFQSKMKRFPAQKESVSLRKWNECLVD